MEKHAFVYAGQPRRIDAVLAEKFELSRAFAASLTEDGNVLVNGKTAAKSLKVTPL